MKSKTITHIILEGCDGVGKDTICSQLWRKYDFHQRVYVRGEISDYVYAKKYGRRFVATQRNLPFLYVVLVGDEKIIKQHILNRPLTEGESLKEELSKVSDNKLFKQAAKDLQNDYHIITIYCGTKTVAELVNEIYEKTINYINSLSVDSEINEFNKLYYLGCKKVGIKLNVRNNQPYFNDTMIMADAHLHNGEFETFDNKTYPHNLIFSAAYSDTPIRRMYVNKIEKVYDFCYPINSKILMRPEVYEYFAEFDKNHKTFLTTDSKYIGHYDSCIRMNKCFGDMYIDETAKAKATIYTARDLASIEMITVRAYEAVLANQIVFVDRLSDKDNKILRQMFNTDSDLDKYCQQLLYVTPNIICNYYEILMKQPDVVDYVLHKQREWYTNLKKEVLHLDVNKEE